MTRHLPVVPRRRGMTTAMSPAFSGAIVAEAEVLNLVPPSRVGTGICFLDHMIDQLTSHGQVGVTLRCGVVHASPEVTSSSNKRAAPCSPTSYFAPLKDYATGQTARPHDRDIFIAAGTALGAALRRVVEEVASEAEKSQASSYGAAAVFCCPLDEAFAEAVLDLQPLDATRHGRCVVSLEPYGRFAGGPSGRKWIGRYRTEHTPLFWESLTAALGADLTLRRVRGGNAHHVIESAFKSFARAFRAALDCMADGSPHGCASPSAGPAAPAVQPRLPRTSERRRATKETTIEVRVNLDAPWLDADAPKGGGSAWTGEVMTATKLHASVRHTSRVATGITVLDRVLTELARAAGIEMIVHCEGDRYIDDHHSAEDVAITLGQCMHEALGDKAGLARMGCAEGEHGSARVRAVLDLSNRPHFCSDLSLDEEFVGGLAAEGTTGEPAGGGVGSGVAPGEAPAPADVLCGNVLSCEMLFHVFDSLTLEMRSTCHLEALADPGSPGHTLELALAAAEAYGAALSRAIRIDPRRHGTVASSKGTLSK